MRMTQIGTTAPPLGAMTTTATYDVIGPAQGTASQTLLFGFIPLGAERKVGTIATGSFGQYYSPITRAAIYDAIEAVPTADALISVRFNRKVDNYFIYSEETVTVKGKAVRYNISAK